MRGTSNRLPIDAGTSMRGVPPAADAAHHERGPARLFQRPARTLPCVRAIAGRFSGPPPARDLHPDCADIAPR
eukprot:26304-Eustigmatos_ZCMA.PRE.1